VFELQRLRPDHEAAILEFEIANRAYFAESISDRGDDFYDEFAERHRALLAEQQAGVCVFHVLVGEDDAVVGRFNLYDVVDGEAEVGYRLAQRVSGRGVATSALRDLCRIASQEYGLRTLRAATTNDNVASQRVLAKAGFVPVGPAQVGGRQGARYERALTRRVRRTD
jgi:[ribosomal protein S5]-alanine N-acetyltransferase